MSGTTKRYKKSSRDHLHYGDCINMECLHKTNILQFEPNTLYEVRKLYDLHDSDRMEGAIDILEEWIKQQNHFMKKDFSRDYLETTIINCKGLLERSKSRLDRVCTLRNFSPQFFGDFDVNIDFKQLVTEKLHLGILPKQTKSYQRVIIFKNRGDFDSKTFDDYYKYLIYMCEYLKAHDYASGYTFIGDFTELNLLEFAKAFNVTETRQLVNMMIEGYGVRIKGIHFLTSSKLIEMVVGLIKSVLSEKLGKRVQIHRTLDTIHEHVTKEILPVEYGGEEKPLKEIHEKWVEEFNKPEFKEYMREMNKACTDETKRQVDTFNDQYMGMPGTFRKINVD